MEPRTAAPEAPGLVYQGQPLKVLGTYTKGSTEYAKLGGYLVVFSGPDATDLTGDYFTAKTDFGTLTRKGRAEVPGYYQHGFDPYFKGEAIGDAELSLDGFGVWAEYQVELRSDYERHLIDMAKDGRMGQSSGAVAHLVDRKSITDGVREITRWPIGEASLTPTPAEPRTSALPLKAFKAWALAQAALSDSPSEAKASPEPMADNATPTAETAVPTPTPAAAPAAPAPEAKVLTLDAVRDAMREEMKAAREDAKPTAGLAFNTAPAAPAIILNPGDTEAKAFKAWAMGDDGAMKHIASGHNTIEIKASNNTDMNIGTAADGGNAVPTGHFNGIIARRDEMRLNLGVRDIPGVGTTVNVPLDAEDDGEFVSTAEGAANDRDAPALGTAAMTLVKYTKRVELSDELLQDEESRLMAFIEDFLGRGIAKTHNSLLIAEVLANGSNLNTTASTTALVAGELEDAVFGSSIAYYLDNSARWVMQPPTYSAVAQITGNDRLYVPTTQGQGVGPGRSILGYGVEFSQKLDAYGTTGNKFAAFGNFNYVGRREEPSFQVLRDPYSAATTGQLRLHYYFRTVYKVLQSEAVGYVDHA